MIWPYLFYIASKYATGSVYVVSLFCNIANCFLLCSSTFYALVWFFVNIFCNISTCLHLFLVEISSMKRDARSSEQRLSNLRCEVSRIEHYKGRHEVIITAVQILPDDISRKRSLDTKKRPVSIVSKVNAEGHNLILQTSSIASIQYWTFRRLTWKIRVWTL